jgi:Fe-S-cluster containining protein
MSQKSKTDLKERMDADQNFRFRCDPGVSCFTDCCRDVTIVLTPYDVLRLKKRLGITSDELVDRYTVVLPKGKLIPLVVLKMEGEDKRCPFVTQEGCSVYEDRPWPCRMYPLDMADDGTFHLITDADRCKGLQEKDVWQIGEWLVEQGIVPYDEMNDLFAQVIRPMSAQGLDIDNPHIHKMLFMALYNLDKFRDFVFKSTFLERFDVEPVRIEKIRRDDMELLKFGFDWIKFGLFGQILFTVKDQVASQGSPAGPRT